MSVLGNGRDEMLAVYLAKTYYLPILLHGSAICTCTPMTSIKWMLLGIIASEKSTFFSVCSHESFKPVLYYYNTILTASLLADQRKVIFFNKIR